MRALEEKPRNPLKPIARDSTFFLGFVQTSDPEVSVTGPDKEELARKGSASGGG